MTQVRAKMRLAWSRKTNHGYGVEPTVLHFDAVCDDGTPENRRFQKATPNGHAEFQIDNPDALAQFEIGKHYYVDFTVAD